MNNNRIIDIIVLYSKDNITNELTCEKALVTRDNNLVEEIRGDAAIRAVLLELMTQENSNTLVNIPFYKAGPITDNDLLNEYNNKMNNAQRIVLTRNGLSSKQNKAKLPKDRKKGKIKKVLAGGAIITVSVLTGLAGYLLGVKKNSKNEIAREIGKVKTESNVLEAAQNAKQLPINWKQYAEKYKETVQKQFLVNLMDNALLPNLKEITIGEETFKYGLTAEEAIFLSLYAEGNLYTHEEKLQILGKYADDFDFAEMQRHSDNAIMKTYLSIGIAENKEDIIDLGNFLKDELTKKLFEQYIDKLMAFKNAETKAEKAQIQEEVKDMLITNFIDAGKGQSDFVDSDKNPGTVYVILNTIAKSCELIGLDLGEITIHLLGQNAQIGSSEIADKEAINGVVDEACNGIILEYDSFKEKLRTYQIIKETADEDVVTKYDELTQEYNILFLANIMNKELALTAELESIEDLSDLNAMILIYNNLIAKQAENREFDIKNDPSAGKVGDTDEEELGPVSLSSNGSTPSDNPPQSVVDSFTQDDIDQAQEEADKKIENDGDPNTVTQEQHENTAAAMLNEAQVFQSTYWHILVQRGIVPSEQVPSDTIPYDSSWETSKPAGYENAVVEVNNFIATLTPTTEEDTIDKVPAEDVIEGSLTTDPNESTTIEEIEKEAEGKFEGSHDENKANEEAKSEVDSSVENQKPETEVTQPEQSTPTDEKTPETSDPSNSSSDEIGGITTDSTGVTDMEQYGTIGGSHGQNPNQQNNTIDSGATSETTTTETPATTETQPSDNDEEKNDTTEIQPGDDLQKNNNNNGTIYFYDTESIIGEVTEDPEGVWDPSEAGVVPGASEVEEGNTYADSQYVANIDWLEQMIKAMENNTGNELEIEYQKSL